MEVEWREWVVERGGRGVVKGANRCGGGGETDTEKGARKEGRKTRKGRAETRARGVKPRRDGQTERGQKEGVEGT